MENDNAYKSGTLKISEEVILTIAKLAISEIKGVEDIVPVNDFGVANKSLQKLASKDWGIARKLFGKKNNLIKVKLLGDIVEITLAVIVEQGYKVIMVAESIQDSVKSSVQSMTGITVSRVNVIISGISINKDK
ncbi:MAG TPA: Asp23/Gls24 family envelope stress response protein [Clostridiales bacterium]|nr:Asp23/Gls24 family envelope stress response protein [Clostridiales bacterium]